MNNKKVCFFGIYDLEYSRNSVLIKGFQDNDFEVFHCRVNPAIHNGIKKFRALYTEYKKIRDQKFDFVIVATPGHSVVWLARILFGKGIIFDAFVSLYNSTIEDRKNYPKYHPKALYYYFLDWFSCALSSVVLLDTNCHIDYFVKKFRIKREKFVRVFVGSNDSIVFPVDKEGSSEFVVHFHGSNIPLQGVSHILESAKILESETSIVFNLYGVTGKDTSNLKFFPRFLYTDMSKILSKADIVLGIFGDTNKTQNVIPNKVFEGLAAKKPVITSKTPAILELLVDGRTVVLCKNSNPQDLAQKILLLKQDSNLRNRVAVSGFELFTRYLTPKILIKDFLMSKCILIFSKKRSL